jgi:hypothetical protein
VTILTVTNGFGKHVYQIPTDNADRLAILGLLATTFAITGQCWSKVSFAITLLRITKGYIRWFIWFAIISMNIFFALGALFFWIECTPLERAWKPLMAGTCWNPMVNITYGIALSCEFPSVLVAPVASFQCHQISCSDTA